MRRWLCLAICHARLTLCRWRSGISQHAVIASTASINPAAGGITFIRVKLTSQIERLGNETRIIGSKKPSRWPVVAIVLSMCEHKPNTSYLPFRLI